MTTPKAYEQYQVPPGPRSYDRYRQTAEPRAYEKFQAAADAAPVINAQHPDLPTGVRWGLKNLASTPEGQAEYLRRKLGFETDIDERGDVLLRKPGERTWHKLEKHGFELADIPDIATDISSGLAMGAGSVAGGLLGTLVGGPAGTLPGRAAGAGLAAGGQDIQRRAIGSLVGIREGGVGEALKGAAGEAAYAAGAEGILGGLGAGVRAIKQARVARKLPAVAAVQEGRVAVRPAGEAAAKLTARTKELHGKPTRLRWKPSTATGAPAAVPESVPVPAAPSTPSGAAATAMTPESAAEQWRLTLREMEAARRGGGTSEPIRKLKGGLEEAAEEARRAEAEYFARTGASELPEFARPKLGAYPKEGMTLSREATNKLIKEKMSPRTLREWAAQLGFRDAWATTGTGAKKAYVIGDEELRDRLLTNIWKLENVAVARRAKVHNLVQQTTKQREPFEAYFRTRGGDVRHMLATTNPPPTGAPITAAAIREGFEQLADKYSLDEVRRAVIRLRPDGRKPGKRAIAKILQMDMDELVEKAYNAQKTVRKGGRPYDPMDYGLLHVWDREKRLWRSLDLDTVIQIRRVGKDPVVFSPFKDWEPGGRLYKSARFLRNIGEYMSKPLSTVTEEVETAVSRVAGKKMGKAMAKKVSLTGAALTGGAIGKAAIAGKGLAKASKAVMQLQLRELETAPWAVRAATKTVRELFKVSPQRARIALYLLIRENKAVRDWIESREGGK